MTIVNYDICIIGGGINGVGIARDAAGRGLSVLLVEKGDLAGATSSASTKLIHGGLRYLEHYEFGLVREALKEREVLLNLAPHIIHPMEFILPHDKTQRPAWLIRAGLFLYDNLSKRKKLTGSKSVNLKGSPLNDEYIKGFSYADCRVDDSRLVVLNAMDAAEKGATIRTRTECTKLVASEKFWTIHLGKNKSETARIVVNAAGPWVRSVLDKSELADSNVPKVRLVKGSHIVVPRFLEEDKSYILQQPDKRIIFAIPYEHDFTLIGTTDIEYSGSAQNPEIDETEINYLCAAINRSFKHKTTPDDVVWSYSGVRPLLDDGDDNASEVTRDYKLILDKSFGPPILSIFGGKITTYRHLAEEVLDELTDKPKWTANSTLPGGNIDNFEQFTVDKIKQHSHLPERLIKRYARSYGTRMDKFISNDMGQNLGDDVFESEIQYLIEHEWAKTIEDILWRRSKLGLHVTEETIKNLKNYFKLNITPAPVP